MLSEFTQEKAALCKALETVAEKLDAATSIYALLETDDPAFPFELKWVRKPGEASADAGLINQRLFDTAFLDYGFREVRSEDNLEGVIYQPLEDMLADPDCIGVAPVSYFDVDRARARMAAGVDEEPDDENPEAMRFVSFLNLVRGRVLSGEPAERMGYEDVVNVKGLLFKYDTLVNGKAAPVVAFQRTQPMWIAKKSSLLLYGREGDSEMFADRSIKVGTSFDFVLHSDKLFFASMKALETLFAYRKLVAQQAKDFADTLDGIIADYEKLDERIATSRSVANKLLKIQNSDTPVVDMEPEDLEYRVQRIPYYSRKLKFNEEGKVLMLNNTDVSDFLKMLGDDFLMSPLSQAQYESRSKKRLDVPNDGV